MAEMAGQAGFDWCLIDGEHGPNTVTEWLPQVQALAATPTPPVIRIPNRDVWMVKQALDLGCQTVMVPMVDTADQAAEMAAAMRYPPQGKRGMGAAVARASGYGLISDYADNADAEVCLIVQAETVEAVENIAAIAAIDGVDGIFIGPADLSADMGYRGQAGHPDVVALIADALGRIKASGKAGGILTLDPGKIGYYNGLGATFIGIASDVVTMGTALRGVAAQIPR